MTAKYTRKVPRSAVFHGVFHRPYSFFVEQKYWLSVFYDGPNVDES